MNKFSNSESLEQDIKDGNVLGMIEKMGESSQPTTKTPRTDAVAKWWLDNPVVDLSFARTLELENQELRNDLAVSRQLEKEAGDFIQKRGGYLDELESQLTQLKAAGEELAKQLKYHGLRYGDLQPHESANQALTNWQKLMETMK